MELSWNGIVFILIFWVIVLLGANLLVVVLEEIVILVKPWCRIIGNRVCAMCGGVAAPARPGHQGGSPS